MHDLLILLFLFLGVGQRPFAQAARDCEGEVFFQAGREEDQGGWRRVCVDCLNQKNKLPNNHFCFGFFPKATEPFDVAYRLQPKSFFSLLLLTIWSKNRRESLSFP